MELNLKYNNYIYKQHLEIEKESENSEQKSLPHQIETDNLEKYKTIFPFDAVYTLMPTIKTDTDLYLSDGSIVHFVLRKNVIQILVELPNGNKFSCAWCKAKSAEELLD